MTTYIKKIRAGLVPNASVDTYVGDPGTIFYNPDVGALYLSDGVNPGGTALVTAGGSGDRLVNGASSFRMLSDGTLTLTHPAEPALHPLSTVLTVQKAAGNYHTISGAYGLSLQATPVPSGYGLNTNTNFIDIFHDGISVNVNNNTWGFGTDGATTFPTLTVPISDNTTPNGTGQTLKFSDSSQQAIIFGPVSTGSSPSAQRIIIQGAPGFTGTAGEGGDVYLWAGPGGSTNGNGGDIKVRAGQGRGTGDGGYLNFQAGDSNTGGGGYINIESGETNTYGRGGDITVQARNGGKITLRTYISNGSTNEWLFDADGKLRLPGDATITNLGDTLVTTGLRLQITGSVYDPNTGGIDLELEDPAIGALISANPSFYSFRFASGAALGVTLPGLFISVPSITGKTWRSQGWGLNTPDISSNFDLFSSDYVDPYTALGYLRLSSDTGVDWTFGKNSTLTFPNGGKLGNPYGDSAVNLSGNQNLYAGLASYDTKSWAGAVDATYGPGSGIPAGGGFFIQTNVNVDTKTWAFKTNGGLVFPDATIQTTAYTGGGSTSYTPNDTDNWNEPAINTISAALDELAARVTALQNYEIDGGNAYTPAVGELLIDGNGA